MRRNMLTVIVALVVVIIAGVAFFYWQSEKEAVVSQAKILKYCSEGSPENFNPQINTTGTSFDAARPVYNRLVEFKLGTTEVIPGLAESWTISDDGTVYTFKLRKGVKFHASGTFKPTRDFNADDVLFSFNSQWKEDHPFYKVQGHSYDYFNDMGMPELLKAVEKLDDYTIPSASP
jgi:dipeptide transport system substrate-binding protein